MKGTQKTSNSILLVTTEISKHASALEDELEKLDAPYSRFNTDTANSSDWPQLEFSRDRNKTVIFKDADENEKDSAYFSAVWWDELFPCKDIFEQTSYPRWSFLETQKAMDWIFGSLDARYIDLPSNIIYGSNKIIQLQKATELGLHIPETIISSDYDVIREFAKEETVYKPISRPTLESIGDNRIVLTTPVKGEDIARRAVCCKLSLLQKYIDKKYEVRSYVIGDNVLSAEIHNQESDRARVDWRNYDIANTPHYKHDIPKTIADSCRELTRSFGLTFSAIDFAVTPQGDYVFLELNPQGRWLWLEKLAGIDVTFLLADKLLTLSKDSVS
jgi:glutathione synthase/RimK-type ligase-like ATP-grasp enzyme